MPYGFPCRVNVFLYVCKVNLSQHTKNQMCFQIDTFEVMFEPIVTVVSEDAGQVEMLKIVKRGRTEQVVDVTLLCSGASESMINNGSITYFLFQLTYYYYISVIIYY